MAPSNKSHFSRRPHKEPLPQPANPAASIFDPPSNSSVAEKALSEPPPAVPAIRSGTHIITTTLFLWACQISLSFGLILIVVGYIGCFSVVQASPRADSKGALVWLVCEALLAIFRTLVWAANPKWDDAKSPIALEKVRTTKDGAEVQKKSSYGIGWMLNAVTADDMHALIVGINDYKGSSFRDLTECVPDAKRVASYLEDTLLVPRDQIVTLYDSQATKERIIEELEALSRKASVAQDAPVVIYFASHSFVKSDNKRAYLVPHAPKVDNQTPSQDDLEGAASSALADACISYDNIVDILRRIAEAKTDNIILILDSCHAGALGRNERFDNRSPSSPPPSPYPQFPSRGIDSEESPTKKTDHSVVVNEVGESSSDGHLSETQPDFHFRTISPVKRSARLSKKTTEILVGHSSHILIAGTGADDVAREQRNHGGNFTTSLLDLLDKSDALGEMTYKKLIDEINDKMRCTGQEAICTSIYQNRLLFNGLFSRRVTEDGVTPVITVQYSDL
ncbi:hypothetical protein H1R20_g2624, partial [Candolleomyces eurysporus]